MQVFPFCPWKVLPHQNIRSAKQDVLRTLYTDQVRRFCLGIKRKPTGVSRIRTFFVTPTYFPRKKIMAGQIFIMEKNSHRVVQQNVSISKEKKE